MQVSRMGQELTKSSSRRAAVSEYQPMARATSALDRHFSSSSSSSSRGDLENGKGSSSLSKQSGASRQAQVRLSGWGGFVFAVPMQIFLEVVHVCISVWDLCAHASSSTRLDDRCCCGREHRMAIPC
eukprot:1161829-Pelagomonas_calceolata.AAC.23